MVLEVIASTSTYCQLQSASLRNEICNTHLSDMRAHWLQGNVVVIVKVWFSKLYRTVAWATLPSSECHRTEWEINMSSGNCCRHQATGYYPSRCWARFMSSYGVAKPQCVKHKILSCVAPRVTSSLCLIFTLDIPYVTREGEVWAIIAILLSYVFPTYFIATHYKISYCSYSLRYISYTSAIVPLGVR